MKALIFDSAHGVKLNLRLEDDVTRRKYILEIYFECHEKSIVTHIILDTFYLTRDVIFNENINLIMFTILTIKLIDFAYSSIRSRQTASFREDA